MSIPLSTPVPLRHPKALPWWKESLRIPAERAWKGRLENCFGDMMLISAIEIFDVQVKSSFLHERLEELFDQLGLHFSNASGSELGLVYEVRPPGQINHNSRESFIQRHVGMAKAHDPAPFSQRLTERLSQHPSNVFDGVVAVDFQIAFGVNFQIEISVARQLSQHVIEKRYPGVDAMLAGSIEIQRYLNFGLIGLPRLRCDPWIAHGLSSTLSSADRKRLFSSGRPIVTRIIFSSRGYELTSRVKTPSE
jgi:hypothetical protein